MKICQRIAFVLLGLYFLSYAVTAFGENPKPVPVFQPGYAVKIEAHYGRGFDSGSGALIRRDLVLTCNHLFVGISTEDIRVIMLGGTVVKAEIVKQDKMQDLALLEIAPVLLPIVKIAKTDPKEGDSISVMGFAYGKHFMSLQSEFYKWYDFSQKGDGDERAFSVKGTSIDGMSGGPAVSVGLLVGTLTGTDDEESYCPTAAKINKFLKGFDLAKFDGILKVE